MGYVARGCTKTPLNLRSAVSVEELYARSERFSRALLEKGAISPGWLGDTVLRDLIRGMQRRAQVARACVRTYVSGGLNPQFEDRLLSLPPALGEPIQVWCARVFRDQPFAIIINKAEGWSRELANAVHELVFPLQAAFPGEFELEITLFIGNYGYTPFGFHVDDGDTSVIHLHSGPSSKTMYVLEVDEFRRAMPADTHRSFDFDTLTRISDEFTIDAGDVFVLPSTKYHTGYSPEYSVGVAVAVIRSSASRIDMDAIKKGAAELLGLPSDLSLGDALARLRSRATSARRSAGGFQLPLPRLNVSWDDDSILSASARLPMQVVYEGAVLLIYAGGHEISLRNHAALGPLIDAFSRLREKRVRDLVLEHPAIAPLAIKELVDVLVHAGSLEVNSMDRLVANRFDLRREGPECVLRPHGTTTEIRAASRLVDLLKRAETPLDRDEAAAALNVDVDVVHSLCRNCLLVPDNLAPLLAQDFVPTASAEELHRFLWTPSKHRVAIVDVPCDFVDGSDAHRDTGVRQLMKALRNNLAPLRAGPEAGKQFLDYEFGRIYTLDHSAVCYLGTLRQARATETRGSVMARLELLARAAAASRLALVTVAGDHSVTYELFRALSSVHGPLQLVHFDAHCDQYYSSGGNDALNHANVIAKVLGDLPVVRSVHIGLREGHRVPAHVSMHAADSMRVFSARDVGRLDALDALGSLDPMVPTYISFDADVLDPTVAPETGHPVPGGISYLKATELMDQLACSYPVVGADFVEVAGSPTQTNNAAQTVAAVMRRLLLGAFTFEASPTNVHLRDTHAAR